jgi:hypothetical protein
MSENTFQIVVPENISFDEIIKSQEEGGRFVFFYTLFPLPWFQPVKRMSKIYYLKPNETALKYARKFNVFNRIWGWWGIPFGPSACYKAIKNNKTGNDISADIFENLTENDFKKRIVSIIKINDIFSTIDKSIIKELKKSFELYSNQGGYLTERPIVGYYIDTEKPHYIIGINKNDLQNNEEILTAIRKYFYKHTQFKFVDINEENEIAQKLKTQGHKIE